MARKEPNLDAMRHLRLEEVLMVVPVSKTTLYRMIKESKFPKSVPISDGLVGWRYLEVKAYVERVTKKPVPADDVEDII